ncbi:MAG: hypothetical protein WC071_13975 [Victivallaceae bacterium]
MPLESRDCEIRRCRFSDEDILTTENSEYTEGVYLEELSADDTD